MSQGGQTQHRRCPCRYTICRTASILVAFKQKEESVVAGHTWSMGYQLSRRHWRRTPCQSRMQNIWDTLGLLCERFAVGGEKRRLVCRWRGRSKEVQNNEGEYADQQYFPSRGRRNRHCSRELRQERDADLPLRSSARACRSFVRSWSNRNIWKRLFSCYL